MTLTTKYQIDGTFKTQCPSGDSDVFLVIGVHITKYDFDLGSLNIAYDLLSCGEVVDQYTEKELDEWIEKGAVYSE